MQLEVGEILEGRVTGVTKFGAFVELPEGNTGMVHISEVAPVFVKEIRNYVKEDQKVKVKVLSIGESGKISLSMKRAEEKKPEVKRPVKRSSRPSNIGWQGSNKGNNDPVSFEDMMSKFKKTSDEKMSELKRATESKRGGFSRRGSGQFR